MHMPDPFAEHMHKLQRVAAAEPAVAGIKIDADSILMPSASRTRVMPSTVSVIRPCGSINSSIPSDSAHSTGSCSFSRILKSFCSSVSPRPKAVCGSPSAVMTCLIPRKCASLTALMIWEVP